MWNETNADDGQCVVSTKNNPDFAGDEFLASEDFCPRGENVFAGRSVLPFEPMQDQPTFADLVKNYLRRANQFVIGVKLNVA